MMTKKLDPKTIKQIEALVRKGYNATQIASELHISYSTAYFYTTLKPRGFASYSAYQEDLAKKKGFASRTAYQEDLAKRRGFASYSAYQEDRVKKKGFASYSAYQEDLAARRSKKEPYQELSILVNDILAMYDETQTWLAQQLGVSKMAITQYVKGKHMPSEEIQLKMIGLLEKTPSSSLEEKVEE